MTTFPFKDIPLPLPAPELFLQGALVLAFAAHILFVNLVVGGSLLTLFFQIRGLKDPKFDELAHAIAKTITVNKSLAVVMGVAPLLLLNVLYTVFIYSANALTGFAWFLIVPLVTAAFVLTYAHKYSWDVMAENKPLHIALGAMATILFLIIPLVFLTNMNLMLFPDSWSRVQGFFSALVKPNVLPRYLHFLAASLSVTALFMVAYSGRSSDILCWLQRHGIHRGTLKRDFYGIVFGVTLVQFLAGPLVLVTLPSQGMSFFMLAFILSGAALAVLLAVLIWKEMRSPDHEVGRRFPSILVVMTTIVACMVLGRHFYRETALQAHKSDMKSRTEAFVAASEQAAYDAANEALAPKDPLVAGKSAFDANCAGCHQVDKNLVGPSVLEIASIYTSNEDGIVAWSKAPGKKRADSPQMPAMSHVKDKDLAAIAKWMLAQKK